MKKETVLNHIEEIKKIHLIQIEKINYLINGLSLNVEPSSMKKQECCCCQWFGSEEKRLRALTHSHFFDEVERLHTLWHDEYCTIYKIFYPENLNFFSRIIGKKHQASLLERDRAKAYFSDLKQTTDQLIRKLEVIEKRMVALPEKMFSALDE